MNSPAPNRLPRAWYEAPIRGFLETPDDAILGALARGSGDHAVESAQTQAWLAQIALLKRWLAGGTEGSVYFEFNIPRMGRRIDAVLLLGGVVAVLEFKVGEARFERAALDQAWDYALDLKNFHKESHERRIVPILIATEAKGANLSPQAAAARRRFAHDEVAEMGRFAPQRGKQSKSLSMLRPVLIWDHSTLGCGVAPKPKGTRAHSRPWSGGLQCRRPLGARNRRPVVARHLHPGGWTR